MTTTTLLKTKIFYILLVLTNSLLFGTYFMKTTTKSLECVSTTPPSPPQTASNVYGQTSFTSSTSGFLTGIGCSAGWEGVVEFNNLFPSASGSNPAISLSSLIV